MLHQWAGWEVDLLSATRPWLPASDLISLFKACGSVRSKDSLNNKATALGIDIRGHNAEKALSAVIKSKIPQNLKQLAVTFLGGVPIDTSEIGDPSKVADRVEIDKLRGRVRSLEKDLEEGTYFGKIVKDLFSKPVSVPDWVLAAPKKKSGKVATPQLLISDWHYGEVVDPNAIWGVNEYNPEIAVRRLHRVAQAATSMFKEYLSGWRYDGIIVPLAGDMISGKIHAELERTNAEQLTDSVLSWSAELARMLTVLADAFGKVYVPAVVGNHGREDLKPSMKQAVARNYDYLLYRLVKREVHNDPRITVDVSLSTSRRYTVYGQGYHLMHGDDFKGGSGIAGSWSPLKLGEHRTTQQFMDLGHDFESGCLVLGHFHRRMTDIGLIVNGSGIGYNEFAFRKHYKFERPQQAAWITTPENGQTLEFPVFCDSHEEYEAQIVAARLLNK